MSPATALAWVSRLEERSAHLTPATVTFSPTTLKMACGVALLPATPGASVFIIVAVLESLRAPKRCQPAGLGIGTQFLVARDSCRSCSNPGKEQVWSNWPSFSMQVGTGIGSAGSEIRWPLATSRKLESSPRNRRVGAGHWIEGSPLDTPAAPTLEACQKGKLAFLISMHEARAMVLSIRRLDRAQYGRSIRQLFYVTLCGSCSLLNAADLATLEF